MKRAWIVAGLLFLCFAGCALAEEMPVITGRCAVLAQVRQDPVSALVDGRIKTSFRWRRSTVVTVKPAIPVHGLYLKWEESPGTWQVQTRRGGEWETAYTGGQGGFLHEFLRVDALAEPFRILTASDTALPPLAELVLLGQGETPGWVQVWNPSPEKAQLMAVSAHCDDELVFMGGVLPTYAGQEGHDTLVVYLCASSAQRRHEALDGLWACGVRQYPVFGPFRDFRTETLQDAYAKWGRKKPRAFLIDLIRRHRPDVIITHDVKGEYGHGAHRLAADAVLDCVFRGEDAAFFPDSYEKWGGWQPQKCYLHLYPDRPVTLDFDRPLSAFGGKTGREVADEAFSFHVSQQKIRYRASDRGAYDCARWGLAFTLVGEDVAGESLFENIADLYAQETQAEQFIF